MLKKLVIIMMTLSTLSTAMTANSATERPDDQQQDMLAKAELLLRQNEVDSALDLLNKHEELTGTTKYDYLLGLASLRSGKPGMAIFALERVVAQSPDTGAYLLDLGRAYFDAKDFLQARDTFNRVNELSPPSAIRLIINDYMNRIDGELNPNPFNFRANFGLSVGNDSNVNNGTDANYLKINNLFVILDDNAKRHSSSMAEGKFNTGIDYLLSKRLKLFADASVSHLDYPTAPEVNTSRGIGSLGLNFTGKKWQSINVISALRTDVNEQLNSYVGYGYTDQQWAFSKQWSGALFSQAGISRLPYKYSNHNAKFIGGGARLSLNLGRAFVSTSASGMWNRTDKSSSMFAYKAAIIDATSRFGVNKNTIFYINAQAKYADYYRGLFYGSLRNDAIGQLTSGFYIKTSPKWTLRPEISYTTTKSTVDLYEYDKVKVSVSILTQVI